MAIKTDRRDRLHLAGPAPAVPRRGRVIARLRHPNIIPIYAIGEARRAPFFSLEFAEGGNLAERLAQGPITGRQAAELVRDAARAVQRRSPGRDHPPRPQAQQRPARRPTAPPRSATSAWPSSWATTRPGRSPARYWARPATWRPSRPRAVRWHVGPAADIYALGRSSTRR